MSRHRTPLFFAAVWISAATAGALGAAERASAHRFRAVDPATWHTESGQPFVELKEGRAASAEFTVPEGGAGFYAIAGSRIRRDDAVAGRIALSVRVSHAGIPPEREPPPAVATTLAAGELFDFDSFLGYLDAGDTVRLTIGPGGDGTAGDRADIDCRVERVPLIPVSVMTEDAGDTAAWSLIGEVDAAGPAARRLAWGRGAEGAFTVSGDVARVAPRSGGHDAVAAFRVPHSGTYALHDAWVAAPRGDMAVRIFVGDEIAPRRVVSAAAASGRVSLNTDLGYVAKDDIVWLAFAGEGATAEFAGSIVEWAPRRPPLRVRRGNDGWLSVFEPDAPRRAVAVPAERWITVAAREGDATAAIREALAQAGGMQRGNDYVGVRLERGKTYVVASQQVGGGIFPVRNANRLVFDGNGATLRVASPELTRKDIELFVLRGSRNVVLADLTVESTAVPFTTGEILNVGPRGENTQTVTFRVDPGALDPLRDISRDGRNNGYAYDPRIPGRLALGTWTHYPGDGNPSIRATDTPGVFTHRVTRTNDSIEPGGKWLIKNKRAGVVYLTTGNGAENITLSGVDGRAPGGGQLRFWQTSGVNILGCRFEPDGANWISSSSDGVHGRGREGVWIEDTLIRGVCEDIMNTYGQNMIVQADDDPDDAVMSLRMFTRGSESFDDGAPPVPGAESVAVGDQLVFFNPRNGRVIGYAQVRAMANGRFTLSNAVPGVDPWEPKDGKTATMVYNTRVAGRFFVRDSRFMDSMRFGVYLKARGGVIFGSQFEGLSGPAIFAANEPEWPEGPPATHLWVQGCTFSQNNYGYMPRHRDFMVVDPADISVYTRRLRDPAEPDDFRANITHGQYANSHMTFVGNVFHDWRGMGISARNAHNVRIEDNVFLPPVNDEVMRATLADDPALNASGRGAYAAIFLDSIDGARVAGNRFVGLPSDDRTLVRAEAVAGLVALNNTRVNESGVTPLVSLSFNEWFGTTSREAAGVGAVVDEVNLGQSVVHRAGRVGAGAVFIGGAPAEFVQPGDIGGAPLRRCGIALWARPDSADEQVIYAQGDAEQGLAFGVTNGRWSVGVWGGGRGQWLDLGPVMSGKWTHLSLVFDGEAQTLRGFVDGLEMASASAGLPMQIETKDACFGGAATGTRLDAQRTCKAGDASYRGGLDEFRLVRGNWSADDVAALALKTP